MICSGSGPTTRPSKQNKLLHIVRFGAFLKEYNLLSIQTFSYFRKVYSGSHKTVHDKFCLDLFFFLLVR
jgi:hypothetical protein